LSGAWRGILQFDQCTPMCSQRSPSIPFTLTVLPRSDGYDASFVGDVFAAKLTGARGADGAVVISGAEESVPGSKPGTVVSRLARSSRTGRGEP
jgi:hypothetical protein